LKDDTLKRYRATEGFTPTIHVVKPIPWAFTFPLLHRPEEVWEYGVGIDWAGWAVERVTSMTLENYLEKNVWGPLGIKSMTFHPKTKPTCLDKLTDMSVRAGGENTEFGIPADPDGKVEYTDDRVWNLETPGISAGAGGYGNLIDYQRMLQSICANDEKLLKQSTVEEMFKPQLSESARKAFMQKLTVPETNQSYGGLPLGTQFDYGLGGCLIMEDLPGGMKKGTMIWYGYPNLFWFCDRDSGLSGILGTQLFLAGDAKVNELFEEWEKELYSKLGKEKS
jgi:CubicO group peptidase (beta-lactamase class C family)